MEFLQANWFSLIMLLIIGIERAVSHGVAKQKAAEIIKKVGEMEAAVDGAVMRLAEHASDSDLHITPTLLELFKERNDYVKNELGNTRADVQRIEQMLNKM
jgi:hypothetical protein